jgi:aminopeptidase N
MLQKSQNMNQYGLGYGLEGEGYRSFEFPGAKPHYSPDRPGQVEHIALNLELDLDRCQCQGTCQIRLMPTRSGIQHLILDAVGQDIQQVTVNETIQRFDYDGEYLQVYLSQPLQTGEGIELAITYHLDRPQRGLYFIHPTEHYPDKPIQVWTQGEDEDSRYWFPCFDYPGQLATSEIRATVPADFQVISNGELQSIVEKGTHKIYHWFQKEIHPTYLMTLVVGQFAQLQDQWRGKPVLYYVQPGREADAQRTMGKTPQMIEFFSQTFGTPFPFPKYAQVCVDNFIFGGMENTSTTLLTDRCLLDERAALDDRRSETLVAHELAHQWFGDLVVIKHWSHAWIKEGMATYAETLWINQEYGQEEAAYYQLQTTRSYLDEDAFRYRRPIVTHVYREPIELYDRHLYEKGACVYHLLRHELGDDLFWKSIHAFVRTYSHRTVETIDLLRAIETTTGRNLLSIFDQYVFRGGHPDYKVSYSWDEESHLAKVTVTQTQAIVKNKGKDCFDLKINLNFHLIADNPNPPDPSLTPETIVQSFSVRVHERQQSFFFAFSHKPKFLSFDPGNAILKTLELDYPLPELKAQLQQDPDPVGRIFAAIALAKKGGLEALKILGQALTSDRFWGVRVEVAYQIAEIKLDQSFAVLEIGLADPNPRVRRATVKALANLKIQPSYEVLKNLVAKGDPSYLVEADALAALGQFADVGRNKSEPPHQTLQESEILAILRQALQERSSWNEVVRVGAMRGLSAMKTSAAALELILDYLELGTPQPLRLAAIRALGTIASGQPSAQVDRIVTHLENLSRDTFFLTQVAIVMALEKMALPQALSILRSLADHTTDGRVRLLAEEAIVRVQSNLGTEKGMEALRSDLDTLRTENQDLRSRLESLEARL